MTSGKQLKQTVVCLAALLLIQCEPAKATKGVDASTALTQQAVTCMQNEGIQFIVLRALRSTGQIDANAAASARLAANLGMAVSFYAFPSRSQDPVAQAQSVVTFLQQLGLGAMDVFVDVEGQWGSDYQQNCQFLRNFLDTLMASSIAKAQVYSSRNNWVNIFGSLNECPVGSTYSSLQLWYAHYDNSASFADFCPFGGWSTPTVKQYAENAVVCGTSVDLNWMSTSQRNYGGQSSSWVIMTRGLVRSLRFFGLL